MNRRSIVGLVAVLTLSVAPAQAFGPRGHRIVGAVADERLAGKPVAAKIADLLDGLTLAEAATLPDDIKDWFKRDPETDLDTFHMPTHAALENDLRAFHKANSGKGQAPDHRNFHYTDVPVVGQSTYKSGTTGRSEFDVVHTIPFCVQVLKGTAPEDNERKITKRVAIILLAHYLGDAHQPLHMGAQYFDANGKPSNPDVAGGGDITDTGGNDLLLFLDQPGDHGHRHSSGNLHGFWDNEAVAVGLDIVVKEIRVDRPGSTAQITDRDVVRRLASKEPAGWKLPGVGTEDWAIALADEILPQARAAHDRLEFLNIHIDAQKKRATGRAVEREMQPDGLRYQEWAGKLTRVNIHKAGWRLANLLETALE